jgi:hypothetical protein
MLEESIPNETLLKDSEAILDHVSEREEYFKHSDPNYIKQLESLNGKISEPMSKETKLVVCIPVAGHQEASNIYKTLESFSLQDANPKEFEVLLFVNSPDTVMTEKKEEIEQTMAEIQRAQKDFPELQIRAAQSFIPKEQVKIANIRKIGTDLALLRQKISGVENDLILVSNDADNQGISEQYVDAFIKYFEENPEKEGAVGNLQFDPNAFIRFPAVEMGQELATLLDQVGFKNGNVMLFGGNSCMKGSIYSSIGGYPPGTKEAEQEWTGDKIRELRKKRSTLGFVSDAILTTSSRRGVATYVSGSKTQIGFGDQKQEEIMRSLDIESFPIFDYANREATTVLLGELEEVINKGVDAYEAGDRLGKDAWYYKSNLERIGISYELDSESHIRITDMDKFIERQELMQGMIKGGEKNMAKVLEASWEITENK